MVPELPQQGQPKEDIGAGLCLLGVRACEHGLGLDHDPFPTPDLALPHLRKPVARLAGDRTRFVKWYQKPALSPKSGTKNWGNPRIVVAEIGEPVIMPA